MTDMAAAALRGEIGGRARAGDEPPMLGPCAGLTGRIDIKGGLAKFELLPILTSGPGGEPTEPSLATDFCARISLNF